MNGLAGAGRHRPEGAPATVEGTLDAALQWQARGVPVVPLHSVSAGRCSCRSVDCRAPGKHPHLPWDTLRARPPGADDVRRWWRRWPRANLGIVTGAVSGLLVLDVDPRNGGDVTLAELAGTCGPLPWTVEARTGGGGRHLYFRHPGGHIGCGPVAIGLDVKADGGIVVCPPSRHASGDTYRWAPGQAPGEAPLSEAPAWLLALARRTRTQRGASLGEGEHPVRTAAERREFAELWGRFGVLLAGGDRYYLCPFHPDHRPSLHVDAEGCRFYCFGCGEGGGAGRLRRLAGLPGGATRARVGSTAATEAAPGVTLAGEEWVPVVGESAFQDQLLALSGGVRHYGGVRIATVAQLVPERANPVDAGAVVVTISGRAVGYLARHDAARLRQVIDDAVAGTGTATCRATITGGWERAHGDVGRFGAHVCVPSTSGTQPSGTQPSGAQPSGAQPSGTQPSGAQPSGTGAQVATADRCSAVRARNSSRSAGESTL